MSSSFDSLLTPASQSISIIGSYVGNRQDAIEALELCANDIVKVYFVSKPLKELPRYVLVFL